MTSSPLFTALEIEARELLASIPNNAMDWKVVAIKNVFKAMYSSALPADTASKIAAAMSGVDSDFRPALTTLVRHKILRTRQQSGVRLYELNFKS